MKRISLRWGQVVLALVMVAVLATTLAACSSSSGAAPPEVTQYTTDWPLPNHDYGNTRATMDSTINSTNVSTLGVAWVHNVPSGVSTFGSISTTPIIMGSTVYLQDIGNNMMALDLATGQQKWQKVYNLTNLGPSGVSVGYGKVYGSAGPYDVAAVDMNTGQELWRTSLIDISQGQNGIDMQTTVYDNIVYISTVPGNAGVFYAGGGMGIIYALDAKTGNILWSFNTVNSPDVWGNPLVNSGGGCWYDPAIDTKTGISYWGVSNPAPFPGQPKVTGINQDYPSGSSRPGPDLYTCSMLALDHKSGKMSWYTQVWPHDISDYDLQIPPILGNSSFGGKQQDIVLGAGKMGRVYAFNRQTGALLWDTEVGEHNGNDQFGVWPANGNITVLPGILGGVETPMAYADGVVYVAANNLAVTYTNGLTLSLAPFSTNTGDLVAIDVNTGHILWDNKLPSGEYGGATVVNDLVFTGTFDGMLYAFKRDTGEQVWSYQAPAGVNAWPAVAGDTLVWPIAGPGGPTSVIGFRLGATSPAIKFVQPTNNAQLAAGDINVSVEVTNFKLTDKLGQANVAGEGHIHYFLDVTAPTTQGVPAVTAPGTYVATASTNYTWHDVPAGTHTLSVELVNNDHTPLSSPVVQTITVTADTNPRITITQPTNGAITRAGSITVNVSVSNLNLVDKLGQVNVPGEGHIHYFLDVTPPTTPGQPAVTGPGTYAATADTTYTWQNVPVGLHTLSVELVNNDHTPLSPAVVTQIQVYAISYTGGLGGQ
ncbi:MAG: PQQ-binding-like beta-propeller repeat protein [Methanothrix sp.]|nr:PQQ-binding-like beta-propeller repeat protein [Methanothrix sp.]